jgi:hypothetical protein
MAVLGVLRGVNVVAYWSYYGTKWMLTYYALTSYDQRAIPWSPNFHLQLPTSFHPTLAQSYYLSLRRRFLNLRLLPLHLLLILIPSFSSPFSTSIYDLISFLPGT